MSMRQPLLKQALLLLLVPLLCAFDPFRASNSHVERGNAELAAGKLKEALDDYQKAARELPEEPGVHYNLGIAQYKIGQLDAARQSLQRATGAGDPELRAKALFNLGNVHLEQKHYKDAVDAYRRALRLRPGHRPTQWNLELALRRVEEQKKKEQEKKDKNKKDQKKDQKKEQNKDQKKEQKQDDKKQQNQSKQDQKKPEPKKQDQNKEAPKPTPEMNQTLDALDRNDKNLQRQRARMQMGGGLHRPAKDW